MVVLVISFASNRENYHHTYVFSEVTKINQSLSYNVHAHFLHSFSKWPLPDLFNDFNKSIDFVNCSVFE